MFVGSPHFKVGSRDEVVDWLFETHGLVVGMEPCDHKKWAGFVRVSGMSLDNVLDGFSIYPDESRYLALDEAIISAIELIETDD